MDTRQSSDPHRLAWENHCWWFEDERGEFFYTVWKEDFEKQPLTDEVLGKIVVEFKSGSRFKNILDGFYNDRSKDNKEWKRVFNVELKVFLDKQSDCTLEQAEQAATASKLPPTGGPGEDGKEVP
jgi:dTDP-4-dehydrorhamnose 3,5-epimerase-like enzyme